MTLTRGTSGTLSICVLLVAGMPASAELHATTVTGLPQGTTTITCSDALSGGASEGARS